MCYWRADLVEENEGGGHGGEGGEWQGRLDVTQRRTADKNVQSGREGGRIVMGNGKREKDWEGDGSESNDDLNDTQVLIDTDEKRDLKKQQAKLHRRLVKRNFVGAPQMGAGGNGDFPLQKIKKKLDRRPAHVIKRPKNAHLDPSVKAVVAGLFEEEAELSGSDSGDEDEEDIRGRWRKGKGKGKGEDGSDGIARGKVRCCITSAF